MSSPLKVVIAGASGRMGQVLIAQVLASDKLKLHAALDAPNSKALGLDAGLFLGVQTDVLLSDQVEDCLKGADVLIDFTRPEATEQYLRMCRAQQVAMIIGTTGLSEAQKQAVEHAATLIPIVYASNYSIGVNLCFKLLSLAAQTLDEDYDIEIVETHHRHKVDAPSGTALSMGEAVAKARNVKLNDVAVYSRVGHTGERVRGSIGFATLRGGDVVGDHTVLFASLGERVEIGHKASSRATFAQGALKAALWLTNQQPDLYSMQDVLNLN